MKELANSYKNTGVLHHAYLIEGEHATVLPEICRFCEGELGVTARGNPDFFQVEFDTFGIDDGRLLQELSSRKAVSGGKQIFVIGFMFITREAQNSLLKLFEEPTHDTHFFLITPTAEVLLPTLRSRLFVLTRAGVHDQTTLAQEFISSGRGKRLALLKDIIEEKDKVAAIKLLAELEVLLRGKSLVDAEKTKLFALNEIIRGRTYLYDRAPSVKMILEHIAAVTPSTTTT